MKIALTGGSGFIGTRLIADLEKDGHDIKIIDIAHDDPLDICDKDKLIQACEGCDIIYHLAAEHADNIQPIEKYYAVNGEGTQNVVAAAMANNIQKIIFTSTVAVYPMNSNHADETISPAPFNHYGKSKLEAEEHLQKWAAASPTHQLTIVRPCVVFGEGNRGNVYNLMRQIASGKFLMIGEGDNRKSMAYVGNVAAFLKFCMSLNENYAIYNYADKPDYKAKDLVSKIYQALGKAKPKLYLPYSLGIWIGSAFDMLGNATGRIFPISQIRIKKFCAETTVNADKAHEVFTPVYTLEEGVQRMINHDFK